MTGYHGGGARKIYTDDELKQHRRDYEHKNRDMIRARVRAYLSLHPEKKTYRRLRDLQPWAWAIRGAKRRAIDKNLVYSIDMNWGASRWTGRCELTDISFDLSPKIRGPNAFSASIDRISPILGYIPDNCRFILTCVNMFKLTMEDDEMFSVAKALLDSEARSKVTVNK